MLGSLILKNFLQRPLRYLLTWLAITFGVAAVTAVFIFTDGLRDTFDSLAGNIESGYDIAVSSDSPFGDGTEVPALPERVVQVINNVEGVEGVLPVVADFATIPIDGGGNPVVANGPNIGTNWDDNDGTNFLKEGRPPQSAGEFVIDETAFAANDFTIGERYRIATPVGIPQEYELVGTFSFGSEDTNATVGAVIVAFELAEAVARLNNGEGYDQIRVISDGDVDGLISRLEAELQPIDDQIVVRSQAEILEETQETFGQILSIFRTVLLVFAFIILAVSAFLIFNVFTITLGQRIKELGLLRSVGASPSQITNMMQGEAIVLGILATIVGLPAGWLLANVLRFGLSQLGFPGDTGLPIRVGTIIWALVVGIVVTLAAALIPSIRARSVTPIAALRDGASLEGIENEFNPMGVFVAVPVAVGAFLLAWRGSGWLPRLAFPVVGGLAVYVAIRLLGPRTRKLAQVALLVTGLVCLTIVRFTETGLGETFGLLGAGAILTIIGAALVSSIVASPVSRIIGFPGPLSIVTGLMGVLLLAGVPGAIGGAVWFAASQADGNIGAIIGVVIGAVIAAVVLGLAGWGLLRSAIGSFGLTGQLARENAARNPSRTATTAAALMIGLALVTAVTVIGDSIKSSVTEALDTGVKAQFFVSGPQAGPTFVPMPFEAFETIDALPEVEEALASRYSFAAFVAFIGADAAEVQRQLPQIFLRLNDEEGNPNLFDEIAADLGASKITVEDALATELDVVDRHVDGGVIDSDPSIPIENAIWLEDDWAADRGLTVGDSFAVAFLDGQVEEVTVARIYESEFVLTSKAIDSSLYERHFQNPAVGFISVLSAEGLDDEMVRAAMEGALAEEFPVVNVETKEERGAEAEGQINQTLAVVNVLLLLSAAIAVLGIAIALSLAVFERTREIGLLRAVGTDKRQIRWMIRWEGVIVAAFGGIVGVIVGVGLGVLATQKMPELIVTTTSVPIPTLVGYVIIAAVTGVAAAAFPAWLAGRMNVLEAISTE